MLRSPKQKWWPHDFFPVASLSLGLLLLILAFTDILTTSHALFKEPWDHHKYIYMAQHPFGFHLAPYCWRLAMPLLATVLPLDMQWNFFAVTFLCLWGTGVATYYLVRAAGFETVYAVLGVFLLYTLGWIMAFVLFDFWLSDGPATLAIVLAIAAVLKRRNGTAAVLLTIGALFRESVVVVIPLFYSLNAKKLVDPRALRLLAFGLPAIAVLVVIRLFIPSFNEDASYVNSLPQLVRNVLLREATYELPDVIMRTLEWRREMWTWGEGMRTLFWESVGIVLLLPAFFAPRENAKHLVRFLPFLVLCVAPLLMSTNTQRVMAVAFPVLIIMTLEGLRNVDRRLHIPAYAWFVWPSMLIYFNMENEYRWHATLGEQLIAALVTMVAVVLAGLLGRRYLRV